jgi:hypothetical protein
VRTPLRLALLAAGFVPLRGELPWPVWGGLAALALVALTFAGTRRLRPWSDLVAWGVVLALAWMTPLPSRLDAVRWLGLALAAPLTLAALHIPPGTAPLPRAARSLMSWAIAGALAFTLAWVPVWRSQHAAVFVQDLASPAGVALWTVLGAAVVGAAGQALSGGFRGGRSRKGVEPADAGLSPKA